MANTTTFFITKLDVTPTSGDLTNVVIYVYSTVSMTDGQNTVYRYFTDMLGAPDPADFVAYDALTEEQVKQWIPDYGSDENILADMTTELTYRASLSTQPPLPWSAE